MSIIAEALKKAQRKGKKGVDAPPPFDQSKAKAPAQGAAKSSQAPRAKPVSTPSSAQAAKSVVGARPAAKKVQPAAVKPAAAPKKKAVKTAKKTVAKKPSTGKTPLLKQRKVRMAIMAVSIVAVFSAALYYVNTVYLPSVSGGGITSSPGLQPTTTPQQQAAAETSVGATEETQSTGLTAAEQGGDESTGPGAAATEIAVPPVPELTGSEDVAQAGADELPLELTSVAEILDQTGDGEVPPVDNQVNVGSGSFSPPAGSVPPSIISKGAQEKPLRDDIYHFNMAVYFQRKGAVREALSEYEEVIRLSPHNAEVFSNMGVLYNQIGEFEQAVAVLQKALLIDPRYSKARNNLAVAYYRAGQYELAMEQANRAIDIEPGNLDALNNLGLIYRRMDRLELAERSFRRALTVDTGYPAAHYNLALLYEQTGQLAQAGNHYRSFLAGGGGSEQLNAKVSARLRELSSG
jgi:tetratricopeptide (TPR) repeat protein